MLSNFPEPHSLDVQEARRKHGLYLQGAVSQYVVLFLKEAWKCPPLTKDGPLECGYCLRRFCFTGRFLYFNGVLRLMKDFLRNVGHLFNDIKGAQGCKA